MFKVSKIILLLAFILVLVSCKSKAPIPTAKLEFNYSVPDNTITIIIQPFNDLPNGSARYVEQFLKQVYPKVLVNKPIQLPRNAFIPSIHRYSADSLIQFLSKNTSKGFVTIGLTQSDICTNENKNPFWGIMGLGYQPGKACIASDRRLKGSNRQEKLCKVAIHELGHTQGLHHCPVTTCFMRDAEGKDHLNEENEFCSSCKKVLVKAGWELK